MIILFNDTFFKGLCSFCQFLIQKCSPVLRTSYFSPLSSKRYTIFHFTLNPSRDFCVGVKTAFICSQEINNAILAAPLVDGFPSELHCCLSPLGSDWTCALDLLPSSHCEHYSPELYPFFCQIQSSHFLRKQVREAKYFIIYMAKSYQEGKP